MNDYANLRAAAAGNGAVLINGANKGWVLVDSINLAELLAEFDAMRGGAKQASKYSAEFEEAWALYPSRPGNSKAAAFKAWKARLKGGFSALHMIEGTMRYAAYVKAERTEQNFIKQAATFFGPSEFFLDEWTPTKRRTAVAPAEQNRANNQEALRLLGQPMFADDGMTIEATP